MKRTILIVLGSLILSACGTSSTPASSGALAFEVIGNVDQYRFVVVDKPLASDRASLQLEVNHLCGGETLCTIYFWDDAAEAATEPPLSEAQRKALAAYYELDKSQGLDKLTVCALDGC